MKKMRTQNISALLLLATSVTLPVIAADAGDSPHWTDALTSDASITLINRFAIVDRSFDTAPQNDRSQFALGSRLKYETGRLGNWLQFGVAGYHVEKLYAHGKVANDNLSVGNDGRQENRFSKIGEAYVTVNVGDNGHITLGRQLTRSMLMLSSGQRAIPNTFQGVTAAYQLGDVKVYSNWFNKWSRRHDDQWEDFTTDITTDVIDYIWVTGASYKSGPFKMEFERLESADYIVKYGLRASHKWQLGEEESFTAQAGYFTSHDDGELFKVGAESGELDDEDGAEIGTPSHNDGKGGFIYMAWQRGNWTFCGGLTKMGEVWIEDSYSGDHGSNPFPTRSTIYPDFTNANETATLARITYNWKDIIPGLKTTFSHVEGRNIENTVSAQLGTASERYNELMIRYTPPWTKHMRFQWRIHDYRSHEIGNVDGVKGPDLDHRIFLDFTHQF